jgi:hypothetical protein
MPPDESCFVQRSEYAAELKLESLDLVVALFLERVPEAELQRPDRRAPGE